MHRGKTKDNPVGMVPDVPDLANVDDLIIAASSQEYDSLYGSKPNDVKDLLTMSVEVSLLSIFANYVNRSVESTYSVNIV